MGSLFTVSGSFFRLVKKLTSIRLDADSLACLRKRQAWLDDYIRHGISSMQL